MITAEELCDRFGDCTRAATDSRGDVDGVMFFALHGASFDGNDFAADALRRGARWAVVDSDRPIEHNPDLAERMIRVDNTLTALQNTAREYRRRLALPIVAVAGSNGKTTTKELTACVLSERYEVAATRGNLNNHIGVPLTLLSMTHDTQIGVVEMGASACGEIALLASIAEPNCGIITNIGRSHLEGFGGVEGIRRGKGELYDFLASHGGRAFVPEDDEVLMQMASERPTMQVERYTLSLSDGIRSNLEGRYNLANIAAAVAIGRYFDVEQERIEYAIEHYTPSNNRSQLIESGRNTIIADCYNANPSSMAAAIENLHRDDHTKKMLILGDMLELGEWSDDEHRRITMTAAQVEGAEIISVGSSFAAAADVVAGDMVASGAWRCFATTGEAAEYLKTYNPSGYRILVKGSHGWALEKVLPLL